MSRGGLSILLLATLAAGHALAEEASPLRGSLDAQDLSLHGYTDFRLVRPSDQTSWMDGGLGKFRFNHDQGGIDPVLSEIVAEATAVITPELLGFLSLRYADEQRTPVDVLQAYIR